MSKLFDFKQVKNNPNRSGFDLSRRFAFTAKEGEILPVCTIFTMPGDSFTVKTQHFTRTAPVQSAAFVRIREYFDWFYVPFRLLWRSFPTFDTQMENNPVQAKSLTENVDPTTDVPYFMLSELAGSAAGRLKNSAQHLNYFGMERYALWAKLFTYFGYGRNSACSKEYEDPSQATPAYNNIPVNIFPIAAYHKIYNDYFRNSQWEVASPFLWNFDYSTGGRLSLPASGAAYWDSFNLFDMHYSNWNKDMIMGMLPYSQYGDVAEAPISFNIGTETRLTVNSTGQIPSRSLTIAQQNANASDDLTSSGILRVNGTGSDATISRNSGESFDGSPAIVIPKHSVSTGNIPLSVSGDLIINNESFNAALNILALRQAEFLQRWKEIAQSGDQTYRDQIYRHWGVTLPDELSDTCRWIDGDATNIDISEVLNTNFSDAYNEDGSPISQPWIKGKAVGAGNGSFKFSCKERGVILCLYHTQPLLDYDTSAIDLQLTQTNVLDFPIPEFDRIGMEELPTYAFNNRHEIARGSHNANPAVGITVGYVPRYIAYKTALDRVSGDFSFTLKDWVSPINDDYFEKVWNDLSGVTYNSFKVSPNVLDQIFGVEADSFVPTDRFRVNAYFDIKAVRNLDYDGMPY